MHVKSNSMENLREKDKEKEGRKKRKHLTEHI